VAQRVDEQRPVCARVHDQLRALRHGQLRRRRVARQGRTRRVVLRRFPPAALDQHANEFVRVLLRGLAAHIWRIEHVLAKQQHAEIPLVISEIAAAAPVQHAVRLLQLRRQAIQQRDCVGILAKANV